MTVEYYGDSGPCFTIASADDLHEAIDVLHTLVMDGIDDPRLLRILEATMRHIEAYQDGLPSDTFDRADGPGPNWSATPPADSPPERGRTGARH